MRLPILAAAIALLAGCNAPEQGIHGTGGIQGGVFNFNETQTLRSLFPLQANLVSELHVASQVYEGLLRFNSATLAVEPGLAERWEVDASRRVYTFHLRKGVRFHDHPMFPEGKGRPLTAEDVVFCLTSACEKGTGDAVFQLFEGKVEGADAYYASGEQGGRCKGIKAIDEHTVQISLVRPVPNFLQVLSVASCAVWPREMLRQGTDFLRTAVGTGPFMMKVSRPGDAIVLERNPNYWERDEQGRPLPYLDAVRVTLNTDAERELEAFLRGHLTAVTELPLEAVGVLADSVDERGKPRFRMLSIPELAVQFYAFNASQPPFHDVRVRRAFAMALDRRHLVDEVLHGLAVPAEHGLVAPGLSDYPYELVKGIPFNPDSARQLLALAGYPGGKGFPRVQLQMNNIGFGYRSVASAAQDMLGKELGVPITVTAVAPKTYYDRIERGEAQFWREGWVADLPDPENFLALLHGRNAQPDTALPSPLNTTRYSNPQFDALFASSQTRDNEADRMRDLALAEAQAMRDVPLVPLYHRRYIILVAPQVRGLHINAMELLDLRRVHFAYEGSDADTSS